MSYPPQGPTDPYQRSPAPPTAPQWQPPTGPYGPRGPAHQPPQGPRPWQQVPPIHPEQLKYYRQRNFDRTVYRWNKIWMPLIITGVLVLMVMVFLIWGAITG